MSSSKLTDFNPYELSDKESRDFDDLKQGIDNRNERLTGAECGELPKWDYPLGIIKEAQDAAKKHRDLVSGRLTRLLEWPTKKEADGNLFYEADPPNNIFNRSKEWFSEQGFHSFETQYSFSDGWDKQSLTVAIYVPQQLPDDQMSPVMWMFHGGGFCTGAADFIPWYSQIAVQRAKQKNAIIIAPNYPLGPEGNYVDIYRAIYDFLRWYKEDGYFKKVWDDTEDKTKSWQEWLCREVANKGGKLAIDKDQVYVEGESAGAHAAVTAMWLNAAKDGGLKIPIQAALLRFPMIAHYEREAGEKVPYMGADRSKVEIKERAERVAEEILRLERMGVVPTCTGRPPPRGMVFAVLLSVSKKWKPFFQRQHGDPTLDKTLNLDEEGNIDETLMDGIERAEICANRVDHELLPPIYIYHGHNDTNCPIKNTEKFVATLRKPELYGDRFKDTETLCLDVVWELNKKPKFDQAKGMHYVQDTDVGHGFDYDLDENQEPFLKNAYDWVSRHWGPQK
ncbi:uncharacterized protein J4E78_000881 [Alternaria triticimaculans]|uniref:uncharacterized protein n=1 Tax=Alternaria triticimaculans TaxID=297637 RepID=UPI0020C2E88D|nr:uncharacterized protein J4E78_000881 [Alternaria triticimaculans]KAI4672380.1 hypothetical protein J4E78_000881 [Alternaria triticimaculans]